MVMVLELVFAPKRLLGNDTPQGNTEPPRRHVILGMYNPEQIMYDRMWAFQPSPRTDMGLLRGSGLVVILENVRALGLLGPRPRPIVIFISIHFD